MKNFVIIAAAVSLTACATHPDKISAAYVSPLKYETYSCQQLSAEMSSVEYRTNTLYHNLKKRNNNDKWAMGVGAVLFAPALLFMKGNNGAQNAEYAQLKGEYEALRTNSVQRNCGLTFADDLDERIDEDFVPTDAPQSDVISGTEARDAQERAEAQALEANVSESGAY
ncbi:hypothetical protein [Sphingomicrobium arenosum]|uniref:hypothetical protein n=1 Tax=Sphingomicrobium arenosum TaxID=2233861 RepID=UPI002240F64E|nr:hypothetical protein [Sphingomicrobium arenosum]